MASHHPWRKRASSLFVAGIPVNVFVILFVQVAPVGCFQGFKINVELVELSGNGPEPGFRSRKIYDDALHGAEFTVHWRIGAPIPSSEAVSLTKCLQFVPRRHLPTGEDANCSEYLSSFLTARFADWTFPGDAFQLSVYLDVVWMLLPDTGPDPDRLINASPRLPWKQEIKLCEDEGRAIWMSERKVKVPSGNRREELTNHIWYFKLGWD